MRSDLTIDYYMRIKLALMRPGNEADRHRLEHEAHHLHALALSDALHIYAGRILAISQAVSSRDAASFLRYGSVQRLMMIYHALKRVLDLVPDDRERPLNTDETRQLAVDLNAIYINLKGTLDNFAWSILHEKSPGTVSGINPAQVHIFSRTVLSGVDEEKKTQIFTHNDWDIQMRSRRNPSAHQIPLSVPPSVQTPEEGREYWRLHAEGMAAINAGSFAEADQKFRDMEGIGTFVACFTHHPDQGTMPIFPTVSADIFHLLGITDTVLDILQPRGEAPEA